MHMSSRIHSGLKEDNPSQRTRQNQLSHPGLPHIQQFVRSLIQGKVHNQQNLNKGLEYL